MLPDPSLLSISMDSRIARLLDANLNRAREGLRVLEDYARFVHNRADLSERLKRARHALTQSAAALGGDALLAARDVAGDVGREISTPSEAARSTPENVVRAAAGRCTEALRTLEEYAKCTAPAASAALEAVRYEIYAAESILLVGADRRRRLAAARVHVLITESLCRGDWLAAAGAALEGGADVLQLREKSLPDRELLVRARALRELTARQSRLLIVNDRPDIARLADADGVHVGQDDLDVGSARAIVGADRIVGVSTHDAAQFAAALDAVPDYIAVGPMFDSTTKPGAAPAGPPLLQAALRLRRERERTHIPLVAIGGITPQRMNVLSQMGCNCVAVCNAVIAADDPAAAVCALREQASPSPS